MKKCILSIVLTLVLLLSLTAPVSAATKPVTKTVTFSTTGALSSSAQYAPATVKITNVTSSKTKDYSVYLSDDKITLEGKKSNVITCKGSATITLQPNKGEKNIGVHNFALYFDSKKVKPSSVKTTNKYYAFNLDEYIYDFSKKLTTKPDGSWGYADGSNIKITKPGTYVLYIKTVDDGYDLPEGLTPVFIVVK